MSVPQYTTPTFRLTFADPELDLTQAAAVYVTFRTAGTKITKTGEDLTVSEHEIDVRLTQAETGLMRPGLVAIQANWITAAGDRAASCIAHVNIGEQLLKEVIT